MRVIIITGATGKIAKSFIKKYSNDTIYGLSRSENSDSNMIKTDYSIMDLNRIFSEITEKHKDADIYIIHAASQTPNSKDKDNYYSSYRITKNLYESAYAFDIKNIVLLSSIAVYPNNSEISDERYNIKEPAVNIYGYMKRCVEGVASEYRFLINTKILRISNVVFDNNNLNEHLLGTFIDQATNKKPIHLFRNSQNGIQNYVYITDLVEIIYNALDYPSFEIFNIGNIIPVNNNSLAKLIDERFKCGIELANSSKIAKSIRVNSDKSARLLLRSKSYYEIEDMVDLIAEYQENQSRELMRLFKDL